MKLSKPELSKKNPYHIGRHRFYELKHYCLQYPDWKKALNELSYIESPKLEHVTFNQIGHYSDPTVNNAFTKAYYSERIKMIERAATEADPSLAKYIILGVTEEHSYDNLRMKYDIPCCKDVYYMSYRRFFWILSQLRE